MKRVWSMILAILMVSNFLCIPVLAAETGKKNEMIVKDQSVKEYVEEKAIEAFPEYKEKINGENIVWEDFQRTRNIELNRVVVNETRAISETESVNYVEYENGIVLTALLLHAGQKTSVNSNKYTVNAWLTCALSDDVLMIYNVEYSVNSNGTTKISDLGYINKSLTSTTSNVRYDYKKNGTTAKPAFVEYAGYFTCEIATAGEPVVNLYLGRIRIEAGKKGPIVSAY